LHLADASQQVSIEEDTPIENAKIETMWTYLYWKVCVDAYNTKVLHDSISTRVGAWYVR